MPINFLDSLRKLSAPKSTFPGYDAATEGDPSYGDWSQVRPDFQSDSNQSYGDVVKGRNADVSSALSRSVRDPYAGVDQESLPALRGARQSELESNLVNDPGNPRLKALYGFLNRDISQDPDTGTAAQARDRAIEAANDKAIMEGFTDPNVATMRVKHGEGDRIGQVTSVGNIGDGMTPAQRMSAAAREAEAYKVNAPQRLEHQKGEEQRATFTTAGEVTKRLNDRAQGGGAPPAPGAPGPAPKPGKVYLDEATGEPMKAGAPSPSSSSNPEEIFDTNPRTTYKTTFGPNGPTITERPQRNLLAAESTAVESMKQARRMSLELLNLLPPDTEPESNAMPGFLNQLKDVAEARGKRKLYSEGFSDPTLTGDKKKAELYNKTVQLAELSKVIATRGLQGGSRNMAWIQQIQDHVAQGRMPTATMRQRLHTMIEEYGKMMKDIYSTRANEPISVGGEP